MTDTLQPFPLPETPPVDEPRQKRRQGTRKPKGGKRLVAAAKEAVAIAKKPRKPRGPNKVKPTLSKGKPDLEQIVRATNGLKHEEMTALLAAIKATDGLNKAGTMKVVAALSNLFA